MSRHARSALFLLLLVACLAGCAAPSPGPSRAAAAALSPGESDWRELATDCHLHLDREAANQDGPAVAALLREAGFGRGCVLSPGYHAVEGCARVPCEGQQAFTQAANDWAVVQTAGLAELLPFCGVPLQYDWSASEVRRCAAAGGRGVKLHTGRANITLTDAATAANLRSVLEAAADVELPLLVHVAFEEREVLALFGVARAVPAARVVVAHQLGPMMPLLLQAPDNVWTEVSGLVLIDAEQRASLVPLWRAFGVHRILLGSDWPLRGPAEYLEALAAMPLTDDERALVARTNFELLFAD